MTIERDTWWSDWFSRHRYSVESCDGSTDPWTNATVATGLHHDDARALADRLDKAEKLAHPERSSWTAKHHGIKLEKCGDSKCPCSKTKQQILDERTALAKQVSSSDASKSKS